MVEGGESEPAGGDDVLRGGSFRAGPPVLWRLRDVSLAGAGRNRLTGISLDVVQSATGVIGYSGSGKTSLLNILAGYEAPDSGNVQQFAGGEGADGQRLRWGDQERSTGWRLPVYWVPQNGGLWSHLTAREHLLVVQAGGGTGRGSGTGRALAEKRADEILSRLDLSHRAQARPGELSQGEQSRLAVARGLISGACVLLMDEPLSHVDPVRKPGYWDVVCDYAGRSGTTLIFSCHEAEALLRHAERVIGLRDGGVWYTGTVKDLYECPPEAEIGRFIGRLNWFSASERAVLGLSGTGGRSSGAIRPEWIDVDVENVAVSAGVGGAEGAGLEVLWTRVCGGLSETDVRVVGGAVIRILHRSPRVVLSRGMRIWLREQSARERGSA